LKKKKLFTLQFLDNEHLIDKIKEMFEYILEEYSSYPLKIIQKRYCWMPNSDEEENENEEVCAKVSDYLFKIVEKLLKMIHFLNEMISILTNS